MYSVHVAFVFALLQRMRTKTFACWKLCGPWYYWRGESEKRATVWAAQSKTYANQVLFIYKTQHKVREFYHGYLYKGYVSSLPRESSEAFQLTRQTSRLKSRWHQNHGGNLSLYRKRIPNKWMRISFFTRLKTSV